MFEQIRAMLDKYEQIATHDWDDMRRNEYTKFIDEYEFNMAKALYTELPSISQIAKIICIMEGDDLIKLKVE